MPIDSDFRGSRLSIGSIRHKSGDMSEVTIPPIFACPECDSAQLTWREDLSPAVAPFDVSEGLRCENCEREFPRVGGVWVLWSDAVKRLQLLQAEAGEGSADLEAADLSEQVKLANIKIYDTISESYGEHHDGIRPYTQTLLFLKALGDDFQAPPPEGHTRTIIDVGCAAGVGLDFGVNGYTHVVGVDLSLTNLRAVVAKGRLAVLADAERLPFRENAIDMVTCFATLHHLPKPEVFVQSASHILREGGVLLVAGEPTRAAMDHRGLGRFVFDARKPIYRLLARRSEKYFLHANREQQRLNDLAEHGRTHGGMEPETLEGFFADAGLEDLQLFYDTDVSHFRPYGVPDWKMGLLKTLSFQNPFKRSNWANLSAMGRKRVRQSKPTESEDAS